MPHTSHKKKQTRSKRQIVVGEDGWTRVMSNKPPAAAAPTFTIEWEVHIEEAPEGVTQAEVLAKYTEIEKRWQVSESWKVMENTLKTQVLGPSASVDTCVLFGTGSFTGLRQGWIDRCHVAMYQLAAFKAVVDLIGKLEYAFDTRTWKRLTEGPMAARSTELRPTAYAQEPIYNTQDCALLRALGIKVAEDPDGFSLVTNHSFAFCPGAEQDVVLRTLEKDPSIYLGGKLDVSLGSSGYLQSDVISIGYHVYSTENTDKDGEEPRILLLAEIEGSTEEMFDGTGQRLDKGWARDERSRQESDVRPIERFLRNKEVAKVPDLDVQDFPLHGECLYWPREAAESLAGHD